MNVIVSNKYAAMLGNLNIDLIKSINGEFDVDELIAQFVFQLIFRPLHKISLLV